MSLETIDGFAQRGLKREALVAIIVSGLEVISGEFYTLKPYAMVRN